ncbi:hypothetical protein [Streptosporangium roseum]|uniref:hypothetical protein n=1 Tax=Streptosporangium roseum TaxID=2001 RepID=UPI0012DF7F1C|nr:hypothetical protein [Streptosporangium roseum]
MSFPIMGIFDSSGWEGKAISAETRFTGWGTRVSIGASRDTGGTGHQSIIFVIPEVNRSVFVTLRCGISEVRHEVDFRDGVISEGVPVAMKKFPTKYRLTWGNGSI